MRLSKFAVEISLPGTGGISGTWEPDDRERDAAWEMYVELVTRVAVVELRPEEGVVREAFSSLYSLFDTTRKILREYGPTIAKSKHEGGLSFGYIAVAILNSGVRPTLAKWHAALTDWEAQRPQGTSLVAHERAWEHHEQVRRELEFVRVTLSQYANLLAHVADVDAL